MGGLKTLSGVCNTGTTTIGNMGVGGIMIIQPYGSGNWNIYAYNGWSETTLIEGMSSIKFQSSGEYNTKNIIIGSGISSARYLAIVPNL